MNPRLIQETQRLARSWMRHPAGWLRDYLVAGGQDPRLNVASILGRHFLIEALFGERFARLQEEELRFAVVMGWLLQMQPALADPQQLAALEHALAQDADQAEGLAIPLCLRRAFAELPRAVCGTSVPNYVAAWLQEAEATTGGSEPAADGLDLFSRLWTELLAREKPTLLRVVEAACGSANDYRALAGCGLARLLDYTGFDLCEKNVANARAMFPAARFEVGNVFGTAYPDKAFDLGLAHDLLEHLSPEGLEAAAAELCRLTRHALCLGFFQMHEGPEHILRPVRHYHINTLSLPRLRELFARRGGRTRAVHLNSFLARLFGHAQTCPDTAYICEVRFGG